MTYETSILYVWYKKLVNCTKLNAQFGVRNIKTWGVLRILLSFSYFLYFYSVVIVLGFFYHYFFHSLASMLTKKINAPLDRICIVIIFFLS